MHTNRDVCISQHESSARFKAPSGVAERFKHSRRRGHRRYLAPSAKGTHERIASTLVRIAQSTLAMARLAGKHRRARPCRTTAVAVQVAVAAAVH